MLSDPASVDPDALAVESSSDGRTHTFTLAQQFNRDGLATVTYHSPNELAALDARGAVRVTVDGVSYPVSFVDPAYDADGAENVGTNAIFQYDEETGLASVAISFTDEALYGKPITVTSSLSSTVEVYGIARSVAFEDVTVNAELTEVRVTGTEFQKLSEIAAYAMEEDGSLYLLGKVESAQITLDETVIPITLPQNLPTGAYTLRVIGTARNEDGEESESPMKDTSFTYVNASQPQAPASASLALGGNYTVRLTATLDGAARDGYLTTLYEVSEEGLVPTVFAEQIKELGEGERTEAAVTLPLGGRYSSTDDAGVTTYTGLEAGKRYLASIQSFVIMPDGSYLYSAPTLTDALVMVMPVKTAPQFSIEGATDVYLGTVDMSVPTVAKSDVTVKIDEVGAITDGWYTLNNGERTPWDGGDVTLAELSDGGYTLAVGGINETLDSFTGLYSFAVDTEGPSLLLSTPQGGGFFEGKALTVSGITEAGATVEITVEGFDPVLLTADGAGAFTAEVEVDETVAYQTLRVITRDAAGNESMPFGCTLTNALLGAEDLKAVIL
jgi:hypothetical protein